MTLDQSALLEVLDALKAADVDDRIRSAATTIYQALIEAELTAVIGAAPHERTEGRTAQRNGSRPRTLTTTAGDLELRIPKLRAGSFFPSLLERRRRIDQALFAVVMEAYLHGVSTRKVDDLVRALGADTGISKSEIQRDGSTPRASRRHQASVLRASPSRRRPCVARTHSPCLACLRRTDHAGRSRVYVGWSLEGLGGGEPPLAAHAVARGGSDDAGSSCSHLSASPNSWSLWHQRAPCQVRSPHRRGPSIGADRSSIHHATVTSATVVAPLVVRRGSWGTHRSGRMRAGVVALTANQSAAPRLWRRAARRHGFAWGWAVALRRATH